MFLRFIYIVWISSSFLLWKSCCKHFASSLFADMCFILLDVVRFNLKCRGRFTYTFSKYSYIYKMQRTDISPNLCVYVCIYVPVCVYIQLSLKQHWFEICGSTYTWIFLTFFFLTFFSLTYLIVRIRYIINIT